MSIRECPNIARCSPLTRTCRFVNDNFFSLTTNRSHKSYRAWPETIAPEDVDRVMSEYRDAFSNRQEMRTEFRCVPIEGQEPQKEPWRLFLMKPLNDEPDVGGFIVAVVDISEMKAAELSQQRAAQEAKDRKEQQERFVDMISYVSSHIGNWTSWADIV